MAKETKKLSTDPYKGVRDFFPEDMAVEKRIFSIWRDVTEKYGYEEYGASVLEPAELYRAKTGEEIVNEQTYTFTDRGDREVTLRPEMTPTLARMIAARRRELVFPLRWYSIPNLFRYEQPQRGRTREHWQLNVDIFGVESLNAEVEIINIAYDITSAYGLKETDFEIRINSRKLMDYVTREVFALNEEAATKISKLLDKKDKLQPQNFRLMAEEIFAKAGAATAADTFATRDCATPPGGLAPRSVGGGAADAVNKFMTLVNSKSFEEFIALLPQTEEENTGIKEIREVIDGLGRLGIKNARFDQTLMRGFDYYTGIVFEVYDLNPNNRRSVFGGGRYDDLLALFGNDKVPAVGFGAGDLIARDLMETYGTLPRVAKNTNNDIDNQDKDNVNSPTNVIPPPADISFCVVGEDNTQYAMNLAQSLRAEGIKVAVDLSGKKVGDQIGNADKRGVNKVVCIGDEEVKTGKFKVKLLESGEELETDKSGLVEIIKNK